MGLYKRKVKVEIPPDAPRRDTKGKPHAKINDVFCLIEISEEGERAVTLSENWHARWRDENGNMIRRCTGHRDKTNATRYLLEQQERVRKIKTGLITPQELEQEQKGGTSLLDSLESYLEYLTANGTGSTYRKNEKGAINRVLRELPFRTPNDLDHDIFVQWLSTATGRNGKPLSGRNRNHFRDAMLRFTEYLVNENYRTTNPFKKIKTVNEAIGRETKRRAFTQDELTKLFEVTLSRPLKEKQTIRRGARKGTQAVKLRPETVTRWTSVGEERYLIYRTLLFTGLRINELRTLTVARIDLTPNQEAIHLEAHNEKNRQGNTIPIRADLAQQLRDWIDEREKEPTDRLFSVSGTILKVLNHDLEEAGIEKINQQGGKLDIHSFRKTLNTLLRVQGTHDATIRRMLRHTDEGMTDLYTDDNFLPVRQAIDSLPAIGMLSKCATKCATSSDFGGYFGASFGNLGNLNKNENQRDDSLILDEKSLENTGICGETHEKKSIGLTGFEPATSWSRTKRSSQAELQPVEGEYTTYYDCEVNAGFLRGRFEIDFI